MNASIHREHRERKSRMRKAVIAAVTSLLLLPSAHAIVGFGMPDCGEWLNPTRAAHNHSWAMGYLSGMNTVLGSDASDPLAGLNSPDQAYVYIDNYCRQHPLDGTVSALHELYRDLQRRVKKN